MVSWAFSPSPQRMANETQLPVREARRDLRERLGEKHLSLTLGYLANAQDRMLAPSEVRERGLVPDAGVVDVREPGAHRPV